MRDMGKRLSRLSFVTVALFALLGSAALADTVRRSFDVAAGGKLSVESDIGSIQIRTGAGNSVEVEVERSGPNAEELELDFSHSGADVSVRGEYEGGRFSSRPKVRFLISVPGRYEVDLDTKGGSISVQDLEGQVEARTSGGSLNFGQIDGPVTAHTSGGSITLDGCAGEANLSTSGGSIKIGDVDGKVKAVTSGGSIAIGRTRGSVEAKTSGGSIRVEEVGGAIDASTSGGSISAKISDQPGGDCRLSTSAGTVSVYLADEVGVNLDAKASAGRVQTDFDVDAEVESRTSLKGTINGGGPELYLRSSAGSIKVIRK